MSARVGILLVFFSVIVGYLGSGGKFIVIFQPFEWLIIMGTAFGSFVVSNTTAVQSSVWKSLRRAFSYRAYTKSHCQGVLLSLFNIFKYMHTHGAMLLEKHVDAPKQSPLFRQILSIPVGGYITNFICDYLRMIISGFENIYELEDAMDRHIRNKKEEAQAVFDSMQRLGDALPALGIVAAVLGVITALAAVGDEPAILGIRVASALVGTFVGVFLAYGIITPIAFFLQKTCNQEVVMLESVKVSLLSYVAGHSPSVTIEMVRLSLPDLIKPSFEEVEGILASASSVQSNE